MNIGYVFKFKSKITREVPPQESGNSKVVEPCRDVDICLLLKLLS